jgi:hypothetical protein
VLWPPGVRWAARSLAKERVALGARGTDEYGCCSSTHRARTHIITSAATTSANRSTGGGGDARPGLVAAGAALVLAPPVEVPALAGSLRIEALGLSFAPTSRV